MAEYTVTLQRSPAITDAEARRRWAHVFRLLLQIAEERATADGDDPSREAPSAASTSDASRCQHQFTPKLARAQVAEG